MGSVIDVEETWNLKDLFATDDLFHEARQQLADDVVSLDRWAGRLEESSTVLLEALETITDSYRRLARLRSYASLKADGDIRVGAHQAMRQEIELLATKLSGVISFLRPEILRMDPDQVERFIHEQPGLATFAFYLSDLLRQRPHVLGPAEEKIVSQTSLMTQSASALYQVLHGVDLPRPEFLLSDDSTIRLTPVEFQRHRSSQDRAVRARLFPAYHGAYEAFRDTLAQNLYASVKCQLFHARVRNYDSCLHAALDGDNVPVGVYRNLIEQVHARLPVLHRYFRLRARALGVDQLAYHDLYCPLSAAAPEAYDTDRARREVTEALKPLGETYVADLSRAFNNRWIDWHPGDGKRAGAYSSGWAYDTHPYVLLNFTGEHESVSTLAHEMGHAMHSYYSNRAQPFANANYSIFVAEVASTLNEAFLVGRSIEHASDADEKLYLLATYLDGIRGTLFRQTMFAEFELEIHARVEKGEVLTAEMLGGIYLDLLRRYHGHEEGVMHVGEEYAIEWAAIPHFYYDFYVYQYATGITAATALKEAVRADPAAGVERYMRFLSSGGSDYPLNLLRQAGADLETEQPYEATFASITRHLDELEKLLDSAESARQPR